MNNFLFKCVGTPIGVPTFFDSRKFLDLLGLGTLISGVANAGADLYSTIATNNANKQIANQTNWTNLTNAREANALNDKHFKEQQAFDLQMFNRTNAYNSPAAQRERLLQAGINPRVALGDSPAEAQSISSPSANPAVTPDLVTPHLDAPHFD